MADLEGGFNFNSSLLGIIGFFFFKRKRLILFDLLGIGRAALADMTWTKLYYEVYVFISLVFFIFCFGMSRYSLYLEKKLKTDNS